MIFMCHKNGPTSRVARAYDRLITNVTLPCSRCCIYTRDSTAWVTPPSVIQCGAIHKWNSWESNPRPAQSCRIWTGLLLLCTLCVLEVTPNDLSCGAMTVGSNPSWVSLHRALTHFPWSHHTIKSCSCHLRGQCVTMYSEFVWLLTSA